MLSHKNLTDAQRDAVLTWETVNNPSREEFECSDNYRYATVGNVEQMAAYDQLCNQGCCGFVDVLLDCSDGTKLQYGFNYGH
jgi:hypothetical protein